jgi:hypothetical protein
MFSCSVACYSFRCVLLLNAPASAGIIDKNVQPAQHVELRTLSDCERCERCELASCEASSCEATNSTARLLATRYWLLAAVYCLLSTVSLATVSPLWYRVGHARQAGEGVCDR